MSLIISNLKKDNNFRSNVHIAAQVNETTEFKKRLRFLILSEFWSQKKQDAHQLKELKRIVSHAYKNIPYYRESFKKAGITPRDIGTLDDIERIPFLTRADIKENYDKLTPEHVSRKELLYRTTGGSTGDPLVIFSDLNFVSRDRANTLYYLGIAGLDPYKYKRVRLYGDKVPEKLVAQGKYWYEAHEGGQLIMSCYHINDKTILSYVDALRTFAPMYIHSRPSALYLLARHMKNMKVTLGINLEAVFCDGEILYEYQRRLIEDVFKTRLYLTYGHTEGAAVGVNCPHSRLMHFMPQVGILELIDEKGKRVTKEGARGEMVVTGFNNDIMPLIRYRTQDMAVLTKKKCSCGRNYQMIKKVEGRTQDYIIDKEGSIVPLAPAIFNYNDMDWTGVNEFKIEQKEKGILIIKVLLHPNSRKDKKKIQEQLIKKIPPIFGSGFSVSIRFVASIKYSAIGKHRYLDQKLILPTYAN